MPFATRPLKKIPHGSLAGREPLSPGYNVERLARLDGADQLGITALAAIDHVFETRFGRPRADRTKGKPVATAGAGDHERRRA